MRKIWQAVVFGTWPYWVGAVILAFLNVLVLIIRHQPWGITTNIENWVLWLGSFLGHGIRPQGMQNLLLSGETLLNVGVIFGAFWASLAASQLRWRPIRKKRYYFSALTGGILVGYGARVAYGCNIGLLLNGIASNSLGGWIFATAVLAGAWLGGKIILSYML